MQEFSLSFFTDNDIETEN